MGSAHAKKAQSRRCWRIFRTASVGFLQHFECMLARTFSSLKCRAAIPIALRLHYVHHVVQASRAVYLSISVTVLTTIVTHLSTMSATLPVLKQFLAIFDSGMIGTFGDTVYKGSQKGTATSRSFALASVARRPASHHAVGPGDQDELRLQPAFVGEVHTEIGADEASSVRSDASGQAIIRKKQEWEVKHEYVDREHAGPMH